MTRTTAAAILALAVVAAACGEADAVMPEEAASSPPAAGICLEGAEDCDDTVIEDPGPAPEDDAALDEGAMIRDAQSLLGQGEDEVLELWADARVGRRDGEHMALTEDYVIGRKTIATEDDGTGVHRVVEVTVELTEGPMVITD